VATDLLRDGHGCAAVAHERAQRLLPRRHLLGLVPRAVVAFRAGHARGRKHARHDGGGGELRVAPALQELLRRVQHHAAQRRGALRDEHHGVRGHVLAHARQHVPHQRAARVSNDM